MKMKLCHEIKCTTLMTQNNDRLSFNDITLKQYNCNIMTLKRDTDSRSLYTPYTECQAKSDPSLLAWLLRYLSVECV